MFDGTRTDGVGTGHIILVVEADVSYFVGATTSFRAECPRDRVLPRWLPKLDRRLFDRSSRSSAFVR